MNPCWDFALHSPKDVTEELQIYWTKMAVDRQKTGLEEVLLGCWAEHYQLQQVSSVSFSQATTSRRQTRNPRSATLAG